MLSAGFYSFSSLKGRKKKPNMCVKCVPLYTRRQEKFQVPNRRLMCWGMEIIKLSCSEET